MRSILYICYIESIMVYPENAEQVKTVKAVLKALKVQFEPHKEELPSHVLKSIEISLEQYKNGQTISLEEFKEKHLFRK